MSNASMPNQASEPNQEVGVSQQAQLFAPPNAGGSAVLDANIAAGTSTNPEGEAIAHPIASNFSSATGTGDAKTAGASTISGSYSTDGEQTEKGVVNLHNNPDVPASDAQGMLPDTDAIKLPIDPEVNHLE
ncbi:hypothetical protein H6F61_20320 [Cyanobacteria bacterium FACHB-472]|nr:hypothetical protein [Cyanobacteria bacterium FACHB-472]